VLYVLTDIFVRSLFHYVDCRRWCRKPSEGVDLPQNSTETIEDAAAELELQDLLAGDAVSLCGRNIRCNNKSSVSLQHVFPIVFT